MSDDHYLVMAKVRERLAVSKQTTHKFHTKRFNINKLSVVEGKEQYWVEISNRFAALKNLDDGVTIKAILSYAICGFSQFFHVNTRKTA
jgi:hypothetical protein